MVNENGRSLEEEVRDTLRENHAMIGEVYRLVKKIHHHMVWDQIMSVIKIALIVIPLVYGYMMLAPQLKQVMSMYGSLLGGNADTETTGAPTGTYQLNQDVLQNVSPEILNQLKKSGIIK